MKATTISWKQIAQRNPEQVESIFGCYQAKEILGRTTRVIDRLMPEEPTPSFFHNPGDFIEASKRQTQKRKLANEIRRRVSDKVRKRDKVLTVMEKADLIEKTEVSFKQTPFFYRNEAAKRRLIR